MAILSSLLKKGIKIRESLDQEYSAPFDLQKQELKSLLLSASNTKFGKKYDFTKVLKGFKNKDLHAFYKLYVKNVPVFDYNKIYSLFWDKSLSGAKDVAWPGKVKVFALSSGTSESSSKHIPITKDMMKAMRKTGVRQLLSLSHYDLEPDLYGKGILMLGGSTDLEFNGRYFTGDLSGITASQFPFWFQRFYKPGKKIAKVKDWNEKLHEIAEKAPDWDIGFIVGVPAWIQIMLELILEKYKLNNIHEIWPNLSVYVHGGVAFEPYKKGFEKLLGKPLTYIETYLASEGFIAFQSHPGRESMKMVLNNGIFYEFVPFNDENFDDDGGIKSNPETLMIDQVEEGKEYALLISTCAGAWRYLIGDVIRFISKEESEITITGRTKHFLSLCGEHLSVDNMNHAVSIVSDELEINVKEFTVVGIPHDSLFAHHWYIGTDEQVNATTLITRLDEVLKELNDDYRVERNAALKNITVDVLPTKYFYDWMKQNGKEGGQNKFPRVLKNKAYNSWIQYLDTVMDK